MRPQFSFLRSNILFMCLVALCCNVFAQEKTKVKDDNMNMKTKGGMMANAATPLDTLVIERVMGMKGKFNNGEYKITIPQNDLNIEVDGFKIIPAMGLGTWIDFAPSADGAMVMGDLVLTETDLKPVQQEVIRQGLTITAIHNHFVRNHPNVLYMHVGGSGPTAGLAQKIKAVLTKITELRGGDPAKGTAANQSVQNTLDTKRLDDIVGS